MPSTQFILVPVSFQPNIHPRKHTTQDMVLYVFDLFFNYLGWRVKKQRGFAMNKLMKTLGRSLEENVIICKTKMAAST